MRPRETIENHVKRVHGTTSGLPFTNVYMFWTVVLAVVAMSWIYVTHRMGDAEQNSAKRPPCLLGEMNSDAQRPYI